MKKATWDDIEVCLNHGTLAEQERETLEAFLMVTIPPSSNPRFHERFKNAKEVIRDRLRQMESNKDSSQTSKKHWHEQAVGKVVLGVLIGVLLCIITAWLRHRFPFLK